MLSTGLRALVAREWMEWRFGDDMLQLGADIGVDRDGHIACLHRASDGADRTPPEVLIAVVRQLAGRAARRTERKSY